jgi:hypothetical protein
MAQFTPKQSVDRPFSREEERELRQALRESYTADFPNPERHDCPDKSKLNGLARRRVFPEVQEVVSHISHCSPCSQELTELIRQYQSRQWVYRAAAVGLIIVGIAAWASWKLMQNQLTRVPEPPPIVKTPPEPTLPAPGQVPPSVQEQKSAEVQVAVLDLRNRGVVRGENKRQSEDLDLPKGRLKLSIYLPIGSEEGNYEVRITGHRNQVQTAKGKAAMQNHLNVLAVEIDTSGFEAGKYNLAIRQAGSGWNRYPLQLR